MGVGKMGDGEMALTRYLVCFLLVHMICRCPRGW